MRLHECLDRATAGQQVRIDALCDHPDNGRTGVISAVSQTLDTPESTVIYLDPLPGEGPLQFAAFFANWLEVDATPDHATQLLDLFTGG